MKNIVESLKNAEGFIGGKGTSDEVIKAAASSLGLQFSEEYTDYLREIGLCVIDGHELTGISDEKRTNVVDVTKEQRKFNPLVPENMYVIEETDMDYVVIWQDEKGKIYRTGYNEKPVSIAESMVDYYKL